MAKDRDRDRDRVGVTLKWVFVDRTENDGGLGAGVIRRAREGPWGEVKTGRTTRVQAVEEQKRTLGGPEEGLSLQTEARCVCGLFNMEKSEKMSFYASYSTCNTGGIEQQPYNRLTSCPIRRIEHVTRGRGHFGHSAGWPSERHL